jgi:hypothetical protein
LLPPTFRCNAFDSFSRYFAHTSLPYSFITVMLCRILSSLSRALFFWCIVFVPNVTLYSLAHWMLLKARAEGDPRRCAVVATVVSSAAVGRMADIEGFEYHQTATGFKNIGAMGLQLKQQASPPFPLSLWSYTLAGQAGTALLRRGNRIQLRRGQL